MKVIIRELDTDTAGPSPTKHGFVEGKTYETLEPFFNDGKEYVAPISNESKEIWFISNRHLRLADDLIENSIKPINNFESTAYGLGRT